MPSVFISYSRKDERFARQLATALSNRGYDVWIDVEDIPAGMKWSSAIQQGLDSANVMVVVISPDSMVSTNVEDEWQYFLDQRKPVVPILLREAKVHFQLSRIQYIDFMRQPFEMAFTELAAEFAAKQMTPGTPVPPPPAAASSLQRIPNWTWAAGAVGLAALLLMLIALFGGPPPVDPNTLTPTASDTLAASLTPTRTRRPILSPDQLTATEQAALALAETALALTDLAETIAANPAAATQVAGQTATADALTATADSFTSTPTPNRLQTLVAGRATQTAVANLTATAVTLTPSATSTPACAAALAPRLAIGGLGGVVDDGTPQRVRTQPNLDATIITALPGGTPFEVLDGPLCDQANGILWWRIGLEDGQTGWTVEGQNGIYFLEAIEP
ncbi:MAG: TIR domain-containing protein [Anaerolineae bacterium]|nr:TIR domain-containing protein [Anaerolineae bacterium]